MTIRQLEHDQVLVLMILKLSRFFEFGYFITLYLSKLSSNFVHMASQTHTHSFKQAVRFYKRGA